MDIHDNNQQRFRNVLFLVIDALKFSYLRKGGNSINICPSINFLAENGIVYVNATSNSCPTQLSYPSIFTSTLPLDYGGYDNGIIHRPLTIAEALGDLGFYTIGYSTAAWLGNFYGYNRGFKEFYELFDINKVWEIFAGIYYGYYSNLFDKRMITDDEFAGIAGDLFDRVLQELLRLCDQTEKQLVEGVFDYDIALHRHNFAVYRKILNQLHTQFLKDRKKFLLEILRNRMDVNIKPFLTCEKEKSDIKDMTTYFHRTIEKFLRHFGVRFRSYKQAVPATYLRKLINKKISNNRNNNFFIWSHFMDIHDRVCGPGKFGFPPNLITLGLRRALDKDNAIRKKELFSLRYVDNEIAEIINKLKTENLLDSTLIIICGDHGAGTEAFESDAGNLFAESNHVPIIFYNPSLKPCTMSTPCCLMDIGPTILSLINAPARSEFKGKSLVQDLDKPVLLESLGAGPGDFRYKAIKIAVIQGRYKLIWREDGYEDSCPAGINYLFDLIDDPHERKNLYDDGIHKSVVAALKKIASERCSRLRCDLKLIDK